MACGLKGPVSLLHGGKQCPLGFCAHRPCSLLGEAGSCLAEKCRLPGSGLDVVNAPQQNAHCLHPGILQQRRS